MHVCINVKCIAYSRSQFLFKVSFGKRNEQMHKSLNCTLLFSGSAGPVVPDSTLSPLAQRLRVELSGRISASNLSPDPTDGCACQIKTCFWHQEVKWHFQMLWWVSSRSGTRIFRLFYEPCRLERERGTYLSTEVSGAAVPSSCLVWSWKISRSDFNCVVAGSDWT